MSLSREPKDLDFLESSFLLISVQNFMWLDKPHLFLKFLQSFPIEVRHFAIEVDVLQTKLEFLQSKLDLLQTI